MEKVVHKYKLGEEPSDLEYWLTKTPQERLAALEEIRDLSIKLTNNGIKPRFQRVYRSFKRS
jgi:hypothetical protein